MSKKHVSYAMRAVALLGAMWMASAAQAVELRIEPDESKIITLAGTPATVIVSNPIHADATVLDKKVVIQGRIYGKTDISILDARGKVLANLEVQVVNKDNRRVTVYRNGQRFSYLCLPECNPTVTVGDASLKEMSKQINLKATATRAATNNQ